MTDTPIAYRKDGSPIFDNTATVVSVLVRDGHRLIAVERNNEPGRGLIGLPGGYHMRGETWQQAGARELWEETGYILDPDFLRLISIETDEYGNNLVICEAMVEPEKDPDHELPDEVKSVMLLSTPGSFKDRWAFPRHHAAADRYMPAIEILHLVEDA